MTLEKKDLQYKNNLQYIAIFLIIPSYYAFFGNIIISIKSTWEEPALRGFSRTIPDQI